MKANREYFDSPAFDSWSQERKDLAGEVMAAMADGNLEPLARYLRAGYQLDQAMANSIADKIERAAWGRYHIVMKARTAGEVGRTASLEWHDRKMRIGIFMEDRVRRYGSGGYESALEETRKEFQIKSSATVAKALKYVRDYMNRSVSAPGWDHWQYLKDFYSIP